MKTDRAKGHLDLILLGALGSAPGHGYAIITALKDQTGGVLDIPEGSVYPALHKLEDLGWVTSDWRAVGGRRRREYRLTPSGRKALDSRCRDWSRFVDAIDKVLTPRPSAPGRLVGHLT